MHVSGSGWRGLSRGEVDGLVEAERHALGIGPLELLIAQARTQLAEALPAVARLGFFPLFSCPVEEGLRGAVQLRGAVPVADVVARHARPLLA
jgi:hypothetical protein